MKFKSISSIAILLFYCGVVFAAENPGKKNSILCFFSDTIPEKDTTVYGFDKVEKEASFPGGDKAWMQFLTKNLNGATPLEHGAPNGKWTIWIQFIVDEDGNLSEFKPLTHWGYGMEEEGLRILKKSPKWVPAQKDGKNVRTFRKQPITFVISGG